MCQVVCTCSRSTTVSRVRRTKKKNGKRTRNNGARTREMSKTRTFETNGRFKTKYLSRVIIPSRSWRAGEIRFHQQRAHELFPVRVCVWKGLYVRVRAFTTLPVCARVCVQTSVRVRLCAYAGYQKRTVAGNGCTGMIYKMAADRRRHRPRNLLLPSCSCRRRRRQKSARATSVADLPAVTISRPGRIPLYTPPTPWS